jgi:hypothetical protein
VTLLQRGKEEETSDVRLDFVRHDRIVGCGIGATGIGPDPGIDDIHV